MKKLLLPVAAMLLAACGREETLSVEYYLEHPDERTEKIAQCRDNPGEKTLEANFINAKEALHRANFDSNNSSMPVIKRG